MMVICALADLLSLLLVIDQAQVVEHAAASPQPSGAAWPDGQTPYERLRQRTTPAA
jgi:hypothetical protein